MGNIGMRWVPVYGKSVIGMLFLHTALLFVRLYIFHDEIIGLNYTMEVIALITPAPQQPFSGLPQRTRTSSAPSWHQSEVLSCI